MWKTSDTRSEPYTKGGKKGVEKQGSDNDWKSDLVRSSRQCLAHVVTCPAVMQYINDHEGIVCTLDQGRVSLRADTKPCCAVFLIQELNKKISGRSQTPNCPFEPCYLTHKTLDLACPDAVFTAPEIWNAPWPS